MANENQVELSYTIQRNQELNDDKKVLDALGMNKWRRCLAQFNIAGKPLTEAEIQKRLSTLKGEIDLSNPIFQSAQILTRDIAAADRDYCHFKFAADSKPRNIEDETTYRLIPQDGGWY